MPKTELPYLEKHSTVEGFDVWIVDGNHIRTTLDIDFPNFGQHYRFEFIPEKEFWIDRQHGTDETRFFIEHMLVEHRLMKQGMDYLGALEQAGLAEKEMRLKHVGPLTEVAVVEKAKRKLFAEYSSDSLKVWLVNGKLVRDRLYVDFTAGGHDKVYSFIPPKEIWVDDDIDPAEREFVILHEMHERNALKMELNYNLNDYTAEDMRKRNTTLYTKAHEKACELELGFRRNPDPEGLRRYIAEELARSA